MRWARARTAAMSWAAGRGRRGGAVGSAPCREWVACSDTVLAWRGARCEAGHITNYRTYSLVRRVANAWIHINNLHTLPGYSSK
eukprot:6205972-Pleurochrysis_carterae.AAC.2